MSRPSTLTNIAALAVLVAMATTAAGGETVTTDQGQGKRSSPAPRMERKAPASGDSSSGGTQEKSKQLAVESKKQHDEARKVIDNLKD